MKLARAGAFLGTLAVATTASVFFAAPASAHTKDAWAKCVDEKSILNVNFLAYAPKDGDKQNRITITVDGEKKLEDNTGFGKKFVKQYELPSDVPHTFVIKVTAHDDDQYSFTKDDLKTPKCSKEQPPAEQPPAEEEPPAEEQPPAEEEQPPAEESSVPAAPTTTVAPTSVAPIAAEETPLANTGASIAIPLVIGVVLLGGGAAVLVMQRKRAARD
jgi:LPXTG-motif cell wall-anchored protein